MTGGLAPIKEICYLTPGLGPRNRLYFPRIKVLDTPRNLQSPRLLGCGVYRIVEAIQ